MDTVFKRSEMVRKLKELIFETPDKDLPQSFFVHDVDFTSIYKNCTSIYKVTVEVEIRNEFIDEKGNKWIRAKE